MISIRSARTMLAVAALLTSLCAGAGVIEDTDAAERAYRTNDLVGAMALFRRAADAGHAPAQARLGEILDAAEEDREAVDYFRRSAQQGNAAGQYGLGGMYDKGEGVAKNAAAALEWYRLAAAQDHLPAVQAIAWAYCTGTPALAADASEAKKWGERAVRLGGFMPSLTLTRLNQPQK